MSPSAVESCPRRGTFWDRGIREGSSRLPLGEERANILLLACCYQEGSNPGPAAVFGAPWLSSHARLVPRGAEEVGDAPSDHFDEMSPYCGSDPPSDYSPQVGVPTGNELAAVRLLLRDRCRKRSFAVLQNPVFKRHANPLETSAYP